VKAQIKKVPVTGIPDNWEKAAIFLRFEYKNDRRYAVYLVSDKSMCDWKFKKSKFIADNDVFETDCGYEFPIPDVNDYAFEDINPMSNDFIFCPWCGRKIKKLDWNLEEI